MLKQLLDGDGSSTLALLHALRPSFPPNPDGPASTQFAGNGVWCNDGKRTTLPANATTPELADFWVKGARHRLEDVSSWFGWMGLWNSCDGWNTEESGVGRVS